VAARSCLNLYRSSGHERNVSIKVRGLQCWPLNAVTGVTRSSDARLTARPIQHYYSLAVVKIIPANDSAGSGAVWLARCAG